MIFFISDINCEGVEYFISLLRHFSDAGSVKCKLTFCSFAICIGNNNYHAEMAITVLACLADEAGIVMVYL